MRRTALVRAGWGAVLLLAPRQALRLGRAPDASERSVRITRLLGSRQLAQGTVTLAVDTALIGDLGALADGLHALSALGLAAISPRWRRTAVADAVVAAALAATGVHRGMDRGRAGRQESATKRSGGSR